MSFSNRPSVVPTIGTATTNSTASEENLETASSVSADVDIPPGTATTNSTAPAGTTHVISSAMSAPLEITSLIGEGRFDNTSTATLTGGRTITFIDLDGNDTPEKFWQNIARPDLVEFRQNPTARTAYHVATSLWSMTEWMWRKRHSTEDWQQYRAEQCSKCPSLSLASQPVRFL